MKKKEGGYKSKRGHLPSVAGKKRKRPSTKAVKQADENDEGSFHAWKKDNTKKKSSTYVSPKNVSPVKSTGKARKKASVPKKAGGPSRRKVKPRTKKKA